MQTKSNPAIIGAVRSISGTNVSVQLYPSLNSTISYIYGNGYKVGQVGGFVKIPQGFVNLYGSIVQVGADAVHEGRYQHGIKVDDCTTRGRGRKRSAI